MTVIYLLKQDGVVIYVGQTHLIENRISQHKAQSMPFNSVEFFECLEEDLDEKEQAFIRAYNPLYNVKHKPAFVPAPVEYTYKPKRPMKFRKLSHRSAIGFGTHKTSTVAHLISIGRSLDLVKMYYKLSHISFLDEVLVELGITGEWVIEKPGTKDEMYLAFAQAFYPDDLERRIRNQTNNIRKSAFDYIKHEATTRESKARLRDFNQGKR